MAVLLTAASVRFNYSNGGADSNGTFLQVTNIDGITVEHRSNQMVFVLPILPGIGFLTMFAPRDTPGNASSYNASQLSELEIAATVFVSGGVDDFDAPVLSRISPRQNFH